MVVSKYGTIILQSSLQKRTLIRKKIMSLSNKPKGPQKYQNETAFRHNKNSKLTKTILAMPISGLCNHCVCIIVDIRRNNWNGENNIGNINH